MAPETMSLLLGHAWPGNVRELRNVIEHACLVAPGPVLLPEHLPRTVLPCARSDRRRAGSGTRRALDLRASRLEHEQAEVDRAIEACSGDLRAAAAMLGISLATLYRKRGSSGRGAAQGLAG
jgi:DNA-binding NtrC family response regulator